VDLTISVTTFLAAGIEVIEMVAIVVAVGGTRSWRAALAGAGAGLIVFTVLIAASGTALRNVLLQPIRLVLGALPLAFRLQWLRQGVLRVAAQGWAIGQGQESVDAADVPPDRFDWTGFVLSFTGVSVEGLEIVVLADVGAATYQPVTLYATAGVVLVHVVRGWQLPAAPTGTAPMAREVR
jgi:uncharacterized membrane protein